MLNKHALKSLFFSLGALLILLLTTLAGSSVNAAQQQLVAQGYSANSLLQPGMIVMLDNRNPNKVTALDLKNVNRMLGVVVPASQSSLTISQQTNTNEVFVSNTGQQEVLVSNQNGPINIGDYVTVSAVSGIGMKADANEGVILGQAAGKFDGSNNVISSTTLKSSSGKTQAVSIGSIPVDIHITSNPLDQGAKGVPVFLSKITKFATNKSVSATRIYLGMLCVLAGLVVTITVVYSAIKNGFISLGRNPLAKRAIVINLIRILVIGIVLFAVSLGGAYLIITL